jgi:acetyltransferase-like isoleucine patch superfamily enzyme
MWIVFLTNTLIGALLFGISALSAGFFFSALINLLTDSYTFLFLPILLVSIILFYLLLLFLAIIYCRIFTALLKQKTGIFPNTSIVQLIRITSDVLTSYMATPLHPSMPFLIPFMGAKVGKGFIFTGKIFNADLLEAGSNVLVGEDAFLTCHLQYENKFILGKIRIGNDVVIGLRSVIMPNVEICDGAIVATGAVVTMGTNIPPNEVWGGIPAKKISEREKDSKL